MPGRFANLEFDDGEKRVTKDSAVATKKYDADTYLAQANEEYRWGQFEQALRLYTRSLERSRTMIPAWVGQVQMLVQLDECHEARVWSDKALELFRNNGELLAAKSQACMRLKDKQAALACSDASLQVPGSSPWRWTARGEVLLATGQKHAEDCFQKALLEPHTDWFDRVIVGRIYLYYRRASNALYYIQAAMELAAANGYVWFEKGNCERELGLASAAAGSYETCLELRPDYREARLALDALATGSSMMQRLRSFFSLRRR
ncbi:MAG TPA: hypothetical protein VJZ71_08220 [Phycisphaerae bacterium]|nr:hypothetical protein [Phycisphaerae bacterium]